MIIPRIFFLLVINLVTLTCLSQQTIVPKKNIAEKKWIHDQHYQMNWTMLKDTVMLEIGIVNIRVKVAEKTILIVTDVKIKSAPSSWIDSTIVQKEDLSPIYHSSYNAQRDMAINFGKDVTGFYRDKKTAKTTRFAHNVKPGYFDSNFYPMLINWLPLKPKLRADINIYDYNPNGKTGLQKVQIVGITQGSYESKKFGKRKVWVVEVSDEIGGINGSTTISYIDQSTRQTYKQQISAGGRTMEMTLVE
jgi:hypothetical protein